MGSTLAGDKIYTGLFIMSIADTRQYLGISEDILTRMALAGMITDEITWFPGRWELKEIGNSVFIS